MTRKVLFFLFFLGWVGKETKFGFCFLSFDPTVSYLGFCCMSLHQCLGLIYHCLILGTEISWNLWNPALLWPVHTRCAGPRLYAQRRGSTLGRYVLLHFWSCQCYPLQAAKTETRVCLSNWSPEPTCCSNWGHTHTHKNKTKQKITRLVGD